MPGELTARLSAGESKFLLPMLRLCGQRQREGKSCVPHGDYSCVATIYSLCLRRTEYNYTQLFANKLFFNCWHTNNQRENLDFSLAVIIHSQCFAENM
jgi:hypothetical protein